MKNLNRNQIILMGILGVLILYWIVDSGILSSDVADTAFASDVDPLSISDEDVLEDIEKYTNVVALAQISWKKDWEYDPFYYSTEGEGEGSKGGILGSIFGDEDQVEAKNLKLTGISWKGNSGFAIINGNPVKEGDVVSGFEVEKIAFSHVVLKQGVRSIRIQLKD